MEYSFEIQDFKSIYEYFMIRIYNNPNYNLSLSDKNIKMIKSFLKKTSIKSTEGIWQYLLFIIITNDNKRTNNRSLTLNNCLSDSKILKWKNRTSQQMYIVSKIQKQRGYKNPLKEENCISQEYYDRLRLKYFNSSRGYILCQEYSLFDNLKCISCRYFETCLKNDLEND